LEKLIINGQKRLHGEIEVHGSKNSALPILAAAALVNGVSEIHNCPRLTDIDAAIHILMHLGCRVSRSGHTVTVDATAMNNWEVPDELMREMRSSVVFLGAILGRTGHAKLTTPGGCEIGLRPIDLHISAMEQLGAVLEEDAGKLVHDEWDDTSLVDYNRSGVPLVEIVSEPDMRSSDEVIAYLEKLRMTAQYLGVSDCKLQEGSMRADVNLSVRRAGTEELGTRTEMKNLNSFKAIAHAIEGERARQIELLEAGKEVVQETRRWDDNKESSYAMRSKEDAQDYRYFPEPDLVPVVISDEWIREVKARQPELRPEKLERYSREFDIPRYDAELITESKKVADLFEKTVELCGKPKKVSNWIMGEMFRLMKERGMEAEELAFSPENLAKLIDLADTGTISSSVAKKVFEKIFTDNVDPEKYVEEQGLKTVNDEGALRAAVEKVLADNPQAVADYKGGKQKAFGALMGQSMRAMKGKADPASVTKMIKELLEKQ